MLGYIQVATLVARMISFFAGKTRQGEFAIETVLFFFLTDMLARLLGKHAFNVSLLRLSNNID